MTALKELRNIYNAVEYFRLNTFIETGSWRGDGIAYALDELGLKEAYSIDVSPDYHEQCRKRFSGDGRVHLYCGRSHKLLPEVLAEVEHRSLVWLDAHIPDYYEAEVTDQMDVYPVPSEIAMLQAHHREYKKSVIIVDDLFLIPGEDNPCWRGPGSVVPDTRVAKHTSLTKIMQMLEGTHDVDVHTYTEQGTLIALPKS